MIGCSVEGNDMASAEMVVIEVVFGWLPTIGIYENIFRLAYFIEDSS